MTLQALRNLDGDEAFATVLFRVADHRHGSATSAEFVALAERVSGQDLGEFFAHGVAGDAERAGQDGRDNGSVSRASRYGRPAREQHRLRGKPVSKRLAGSRDQLGGAPAELVAGQHRE